MFRLKLLILSILIILFLSCKDEHGYTYAIKDFRKSLQPYLFKIVSRGVVMNLDSSSGYMMTDNELSELSRSEHPVLRASAFREMLHRKSFHHFDILMNHLDDTAIVAVDVGEFGIWNRTVSDDILGEANWETQDAKNRTIELVLTKHNYLRSAFLIFLELEPQEKYYPFIKDMATRPRRLSDDGYELDFGDIEYALLGLSKFRKPDDIEIIKRQMIQNVWRLSYVSFRLMNNFPDTAYFEVLQKYYHRRFYKFSGNRREGFSGFVPDRADPEDFIQALVAQQNTRSAILLDTMLNRLPLQTCMPDRKNIIENLVLAIWNHPCPEYAKLRKNIEPKAKEILKWQIQVPMDPLNNFTADTTKKIIRW